MVAGLGGPVGVDVGVEGPVGQIDAVQRVGEGGAFQFVRRPPAAAIPGAELVADLGGGNDGWQQAFRRDRRPGRSSIGTIDGRAAEIAALGGAVGIENADGLAALAFHGFFLGPEPAVASGVIGSERCFQIMFDDRRAHGVFAIGPRQDGAAIRAGEGLFGGVPLRIPAAFRAGMFAQRADFGHGGRRLLGEEGVERGAGDPPGGADFLALQITGFERWRCTSASDTPSDLRGFGRAQEFRECRRRRAGSGAGQRRRLAAACSSSFPGPCRSPSPSGRPLRRASRRLRRRPWSWTRPSGTSRSR